MNFPSRRTRIVAALLCAAALLAAVDQLHSVDAPDKNQANGKAVEVTPDSP